MSQTIQARVSGKILHKADRLFNNSDKQVLVELLQNARRAGATVVTITTKAIDNDTTEVTITDNGSGIADFQQLLSLGDSGWEKKIEAAEDPAGMGLFSLVHSGVTIRSCGKEAVITPAAFLGEESVEVVEQKTADPEVGTTLTFTRKSSVNSLDYAIHSVVKFGLTPVVLNGAEIQREDFLAGAAQITEFEGVRIGVYANNYTCPETNELNFHGMVIKAPWRASLDQILLDEKDNCLKVYAKVDVVSASSLHLKLPDRAAVVEDEAYKRIWQEVKRAMYEYTAAHGRHIAPFKLYEKAKALGVDIGEAVPFLKPWFMRAHDSDLTEPFDGEWEKVHTKVVDPTKVVFVESIGDADTPESFAFEAALETHQLPGGLVPVYPNDQFKGYSWYSKIPDLKGFQLQVNGESVKQDTPFEQHLVIVKEICLTFSLTRPDAAEELIEWNDLQIAAWASDGWSDDYTILITEDSEWATTRTLHAGYSLVSLATYISFSYSDDADSDSYETQRDNFEDETEQYMLEIIGGALVAARRRVHSALLDVSDSLEKANLTEIRLYKDAQGRWKTDIPDAALAVA